VVTIQKKKNTNTMKLSTLKLDSLRLLIPLEKVTITQITLNLDVSLQLLMMMVRYYQLKKITLID
jgi:hypothetical protein